ncbi:uncharacterized protein BXZ73DRAFT_82887 [Epithele typhae]|uniref:uncharacterized protein n=1 Tax=Epithele typhae TaxID=378194 RepID=UPI002008CC14|nr:uncharacterized protein BXZ73DRAFT_82887 [Epithele typhae]KAH9911309.1 hypothetical protein BXZ73DRAFT_82887 [Epithele typhae]
MATLEQVLNETENGDKVSVSTLAPLVEPAPTTPVAPDPPSVTLPECAPSTPSLSPSFRNGVKSDLSPVCRIEGCTEVHSIDNRDTAVEHLARVHYDLTPQTREAKKLEGEWACKVEGCKEAAVDMRWGSWETLCRHIKTTHFGWLYACPDPKCDMHYTRSDQLKKHFEREERLTTTHWSGPTRFPKESGTYKYGRRKFVRTLSSPSLSATVDMGSLNGRRNRNTKGEDNWALEPVDLPTDADLCSYLHPWGQANDIGLGPPQDYLYGERDVHYMLTVPLFQLPPIPLSHIPNISPKGPNAFRVSRWRRASKSSTPRRPSRFQDLRESRPPFRPLLPEHSRSPKRSISRDLVHHAASAVYTPLPPASIPAGVPDVRPAISKIPASQIRDLIQRLDAKGLLSDAENTYLRMLPATESINGTCAPRGSRLAIGLCVRGPCRSPKSGPVRRLAGRSWRQGRTFRHSRMESRPPPALKTTEGTGAQWAKRTMRRVLFSYWPGVITRELTVRGVQSLVHQKGKGVARRFAPANATPRRVLPERSSRRRKQGDN